MPGEVRCPAIVRRRLLDGWGTGRIARRYGLDRFDVRLWRWCLRVVSSEARGRMRRWCDPAEAQRMLDSGRTLTQIADHFGAPRGSFRACAADGALYYRPRFVLTPAQASRASARIRREAVQIRSGIVREMAAADLATAEIAEVVGLTPRRVRQIRAQQEAA